VARPRHRERPVAPAPLRIAVRIRLEPLEDRQDVGERPALAAALAPMIVILGLAADPSEPVDRRAAAQDPPARPEDRATGHPLLGLGPVGPRRPLVEDRPIIADRQVDPGVLVLGAGLEQEHPGRGILRKTGRDRAARRARAHHHDVEPLPLGHLPSPPHPRPYGRRADHAEPTGTRQAHRSRTPMRRAPRRGRPPPGAARRAGCAAVSHAVFRPRRRTRRASRPPTLSRARSLAGEG